MTARRLGEVFIAPLDVILDPSHDPDRETTVVQPDLIYVETSRLDVIKERGLEGPMTLVVEILSPGSARTDRQTKMRLYAKYGVAFYWIADPGPPSIDAFALGPEGYALVARATAASPFCAPPFPHLVLVPAALWS